MNVVIINGPNLNLLGVREKSIYGDQSFEEYLKELRQNFPSINISYFQSNVEGEIINCLHENGFDCDFIIINAGGYTHTSVAIADAISSIEANVIEVHISNIYSRDDYRRKSITSEAVDGIICGFGEKGYTLAIDAIKNLIYKNSND